MPRTQVHCQISQANTDQQKIFMANTISGKNQLAIASYIPIKQSFINSYQINENDHEKIKQQFGERIELYNFDSIANYRDNQDQLKVQWAKQLAKTMFEQQNQNFFLFGPKNSGKKSLMLGNSQTNKGLIDKIVEQILLKQTMLQSNYNSKTQFEPTSCWVSIYCIVNNQTIDLLFDDNIDKYSFSHTELIKSQIQLYTEFRTQYCHALDNFQRFAEIQEIQPNFSNLHLIVSFMIGSPSQIIKLNVVKLADFSLEIKESWNTNDLFTYLAPKNQQELIFGKNTDNLLINSLIKTDPCVNDLVCCCQANPSNFNASLNCLQQCSSLYNDLACFSFSSKIKDGSEVPPKQQQEVNYFQLPTYTQNQMSAISGKPPVSPNTTQFSNMNFFKQSENTMIQQHQLYDKIEQFGNDFKEKFPEFSSMENFQVLLEIDKFKTQLSTLLNELKSSGKQNQSNQYYYEILKEIQEELNYLQQNYYQQNSSSKIRTSNCKQPLQDKEINTYKLKEQQLDDDFKTLLSRYNKSKAMIDTMFQNKSKQDTSIRSSQMIPPEKDLSQLSFQKTQKIQQSKRKENPIQDVIKIENQENQYYQKENQYNQKENQQEIVQFKNSIIKKINEQMPPATSIVNTITSNKKKPEKYLELTQQQHLYSPVTKIPPFTDVGNSKSFSKLKNLTSEINDQSIPKEKTLIQRSFRKESAPQTIFDLKEKIEDLEDALESKDRTLRKKDNELNQFKTSNTQLTEQIKSKQSEIDLLKNNEFKFQNQLQQMQVKVETKKNRIALLTEENQKFTNSSSSYNESLKKEIIQLSQECNDLQQQLKTNTKKFSDQQAEYQRIQLVSKEKDEIIKQLTEQSCQLKSQLQQTNSSIESVTIQYNDLQMQKTQLQLKHDEKNQQFIQLEEKYQKRKEKISELQIKIQQSQNEGIQKKQDKINRLKEGIRQYEEEKSRFLTQIQSLTIDLERERDLKEQLSRESSFQNEQYLKQMQNIKMLELNLDKIAEENRIVTAENMSLTENFQISQTEIEKFKKTIKQLEKQKSTIEESTQKESKFFQESKLSMANLQEAYNSQRDLATKLQAQLDYLNRQQNQDLDVLEKRVYALSSEIDVLRTENALLKESEKEFKKQTMNFENQMEKCKEKYLKIKFENKSLKQNLTTIENKFRDYNHEHTLEMKEMELSKKNSTKKVATNKIKVLEDIQSMIRFHKQNLVQGVDSKSETSTFKF